MIPLPSGAPPGPVLAHCDALRTLPLVRHLRGRRAMAEAHVANLEVISDGRDRWVPTFNYDYCTDGRFDVAASASQVGPITEAFRTGHAAWRSAMPVFSFAGTGVPPADAAGRNGELDPFDERSGFARLIAGDGVIVWYGAPLGATTLIHHVEHLAGRPRYRYDKWFDGEVVDGDRRWTTRLRYHVRPMGRHLDYDFERMEADLVDAGILHVLDAEAGVRWASAAELAERWVAELQRDPLALLDASSLAWVGPELDRLGRRFELTDFEGDR